MRISDWSSDVCSSDLGGAHARQAIQGRQCAIKLTAPMIRNRDRIHAQRGKPSGIFSPGDTLDNKLSRPRIADSGEDRKSVVEGKSVSVRVVPGGRRSLKKKKRLSEIHVTNTP